MPAGEPLLEPYLRRDDLDVRRFDAAEVERAGEGWRFVVGGRELVLRLPFDSRHMAANALAALTAYDALGLPLDRAQEGAAQIRLSRWRGNAGSRRGGRRTGPGVALASSHHGPPADIGPRNLRTLGP